ncbi:MAG TPA: hypothetical protein VJM74_05700 [Nitrososphaeraceae archaeon]|nr:hypothetical protein [Nitrososphaeraceae archaeon]
MNSTNKSVLVIAVVAALFFVTGVQVFSYAQESNESASQNREQAKQTEGEAEQAKTGVEIQTLAGTPEAANMTNATMANATSAGNMTK